MWRTKKNGLGLLYSYNNNSLRQVIINLARRGLTYTTYEDFRLDSFFFSHNARLRVRDDLTAPYVSWHSLESIKVLLSEAGAYVNTSVVSFSEFENTDSTEFMPHHVIFSGNKMEIESSIEIELGIDEKIIYEIGDLIFSMLSSTDAKKLSIGLTNTHFNALAHGGYQQALIEDFLYLYYIFMVMNLKPNNVLMESVLNLSDMSLRNRPDRSISEELKYSLICAHLCNYTIRI
jgi:hypothetical protein